MQQNHLENRTTDVCIERHHRPRRRSAASGRRPTGEQALAERLRHERGRRLRPIYRHREAHLDRYRCVECGLIFADWPSGSRHILLAAGRIVCVPEDQLAKVGLEARGETGVYAIVGRR